MAESIFGRIRHRWNLFQGLAQRNQIVEGPSYARPRGAYILRASSLRTDVASIITKIAIDVSTLAFRHIRIDKDGNYIEDIDSKLNDCLTLRANIDEPATAFILDAVMSLCDEGYIAICPIDTDRDPEKGTYEIESMRIGKIVEWFPKHVKVNLYDENRGDKFDIVVPKSMVAIVENPLRSVMNEPNSTMSRLIHKLSLIDNIDDDSASGKLNILLHLPYLVKSDMKRNEARRRTKELEDQLTDNKHGIGYIDATEKVTQLNRPLENRIVEQVDSLTTKLYNQLGMTANVFNGTAQESEMLNYYNKTVVPIATAICEAMTVTFLTKTAISQGQRIRYFRDIFKTTVLANAAETADKLTRNEILSSNEVRSGFGYKVSKDPRADQLLNKNLRTPEEASNPGALNVENNEGENGQNEKEV